MLPEGCSDPLCIAHGRSRAPACAEIVASGGVKVVDGVERHVGVIYFCTRAKGHAGSHESCGFVKPENPCQIKSGARDG